MDGLIHNDKAHPKSDGLSLYDSARHLVKAESSINDRPESRKNSPSFRLTEAKISAE